MSKNKFTAFTKDITELIYNTTNRRTQIISGDSDGLLIQTLNNIAPFSKVIFVATSKSYVKCVKKIFSLIREANCVPLGMTIEDYGVYNIERVAELFALPDDVRAVVSVDSSLSKVISYFAGLRGIPHVSVVLGRDIDGVLDDTFFVKCGGALNRVQGNAEQIIVIDDKIIECVHGDEDRAHLIVKNITALYDYRLKMVLGGAITNKGGYALIKSGIIDYVTACLSGDNEQSLQAQIKMQVGNVISNGEIYDNSAYEQYNMLYKAIGCGGTDYYSHVGRRVYSLYKSVQTRIVKGRDTIDLTEIEQASNVLGIDRSELFRARTSYYRRYNIKYGKLLSFAEAVEKEIKQNMEILTALAIEQKLEAEDKLIDRAVKYFPYGYNLLKI